TITLVTSCRSAFSSRRLSGACCSQCEVARNAELQGLMGHLHAPRSYDIPTVSFHGARSPKSSPDTRYSGTAARGRHWDDQWPADCSAPASRDSHNRGEDKSASRCPRYGGGGVLAASGQGVPEEALGDARSLGHTGHSEACASGRERVSARWI